MLLMQRLPHKNSAFVEMDPQSSGFMLDDLYADIDPYNISRRYDLARIPVYEALNDYYYVSQAYQKNIHSLKIIF